MSRYRLPATQESAMKPSTKLAALALLGTATLAAPAFASLREGTQAPNFTAPAYLAGQPFTFTLADALKKGPVVVYFFPAAHTSGCNLEAHLFSQAIDQFKALHATVIGVTAGNTDQLAAFSKETEHCSGKFPVAADAGAKIAKEYDALLPMRPGWSDRTSYVIAPSGKIAHVYSNLSPNKHVQETLDAVKAIEK
jgi:peroxiredoxin